MEEKTLTCITCPLGCVMTAVIEKGEVLNVTGNSCQRGLKYAKKEIVNPMRILTSTVRVAGGTIPMVSVKTQTDIPKGKIFDCMEQLKEIVVDAPVEIGDIILANAAGTGVDIIATKKV